ncbi:MAG TPA: MaoC family dehydratase N-terminal domain-containing protein [Blastocatellia bacterium]|nr:MaoC family dehydratase N-terminal domain-containing protein [Blastocatellia bacterium]
MRRFYEDFDVGEVFTSRGRTVTETDVAQFVNLSWYTNPRCTDDEFVKKGFIWNGIELRRRIAPPPLGTFFASGLSRSLGILDGTLMAVLSATWRAPGAIAIGDTIHLRQKVTGKGETSRDDGGIVTFDMEIVNQRGEVVNSDQQTCLVARRLGRERNPAPVPFFFATMEELGGRWECPARSSGARRQAQMESQYFEDFKVGDAFDTRARTVTEPDIAGLVSLTWDHHPLYTDEEYARTTPFGGRIAPPLLGIAFAVGLDAPLAMAAGTCLGFTHTHWQFFGPIKAGETLVLEQTVAAVEERDERTGIVALDMEIVNQRGGVSIKGTRYMLVIRKQAMPEAEAGPRAWH